MITRALVTGGAGFIGSNLVDRLIDDGAHVLVVDDLSSGRLERLREARSHPHQLGFHQVDVRAPELHDVAERFEPEVVFHLAGHHGDMAEGDGVDPAAVVEASVTVVGTVNVLQAATAAGAARFVFASSGPAVFGEASEVPTPETLPRNPPTTAGVAKTAAEGYVRYFGEAFGRGAVTLGFANVYGPRQEHGVVAAFIAALLRGERATIYGDGTQTRDLVYVEDVTDACIRAAGSDIQGFVNIGSGVETPIGKLYTTLRDLAVRGKLEPYTVDPLPGDPVRSCLDPSLARDRLGWQAWTPLDDGLRQTVEWFRQR